MKRRAFIQQSAAAGLLLSASPFFSFKNQPIPGVESDELPFRHIHLDFHTSRFIEGIGSDFDPERFADTLAKAHVNSINCFARGHHGWMYYDTKKFPERKHPHLTRPLLNEQVEACHKRGIKVPAYISLQTDLYTADRHAEWQVLSADGSIGEPYQSNFWKTLCLNTPYVDFLKAHVREVLETVPVDGLWLDIIKPKDCSCRWCRERMREEGLDPTNPRDRQLNGYQVILEFTSNLSKMIRSIKPDCLIYYNSGHVTPFHRDAGQAYTHFELESLSSTEKWGYPFFQNEARYARTLGKEIVGMTGKFQSSWGDFHSFKNKAALEFDCFLPLALNAKCSIGDQLYPNGRLDPVTYELVGSVYGQVKAKEPWCRGAEAITEIAVFTPEEFRLDINNDHPSGLWGVNKMLLEGNFQYDVIDSQADFKKYKVLILPDHIPVDDAFASKLQDYLSGGGKIIASFESGIAKGADDFAKQLWGVTKSGEGPVDEEGELAAGKIYYSNPYAQYIIPEGSIGKNIPPTEHVMYRRGLDVQALAGTEVLQHNILSYFDREYPRFSSHLQTPSSGEKGLPAITRKGNVIYFSHPIFTIYNDKAPKWCKQLAHNALDMLLDERILKSNGPTTLMTALNHQPQQQRYVLHLLHYIPLRRGLEFDTIEDRIPLYDLEVDLLAENKPKNIQMVPDGENLDFDYRNNRIKIEIPEMKGHQMIAIKF